jgi:hypothetical protein
VVEFTDGVKFNLDGPLRVERRRDGYYVVGNGMLIPVDDRAEGVEIIREMTKKEA